MNLFFRIQFSLHLVIRCIKAAVQIVCGAWKVARLSHPVITIFGSARTLKTKEYSMKAYVLGQELRRRGISVLTGGGPGIMQAANCGAMDFAPHEENTLGIGVTGLQPRPNPCVHAYIQMDYFFARKWLLMNYAKVFIVFPGGFGTFDELAELLTLIQSKKISPTPIFLVGTAYWKPLIDWMYGTVLHEGAIDLQDIHLVSLVDDVHVIASECERICNLSTTKKVKEKEE